MSEQLIIQKQTLVDIADEVRKLSGTTETMVSNDIITNIESANTEVGAQTDLLAQVATALENKGVKGYESGYRDATNKYRPSFTESGKLIQADIVEGYPIKATTTLEQSDDGYDSITVGYFGKNLFDYTQTTFTDEYVAIGTGNISESTGYSCSGFIPCSHLVGQTITLNHPPVETGDGNPGMGFYSGTFEGWNGSGVWLGHGGAANGYTAVVPEGANYFRFSIPRAYADGTQIQIEIGDTVTDYEAYNGKEATSNFPSTVYNGTYDWDTGKFTSDGEVQYLTPCIIGATEGTTNIYSTTGITTIINREDVVTDMEILAESGAEKALNDFWDGYQNFGNRTTYEYAFSRWTKDMFRPKYDIQIAGNAVCAFRYSSIPGSLGDILDQFGVKFVWGSSGNTNSMFYGASFTRVPHIEALNSLGYCFYYCRNLETIDSLGVSKLTATTAFSYAFTACTALKNLTIIGPLKVGGLDVSVCPLTHESLMSIINALETKTSGTYTITLGSTNLAKLTDAEKAIATNRGWTLA